MVGHLFAQGLWASLPLLATPQSCDTNPRYLQSNMCGGGSTKILSSLEPSFGTLVGNVPHILLFGSNLGIFKTHCARKDQEEKQMEHKGGTNSKNSVVGVCSVVASFCVICASFFILPCCYPERNDDKSTTHFIEVLPMCDWV